MVAGTSVKAGCLTEDAVRAVLAEGLGREKLDGQRVLVIIPDSTRTAPIPLLFRVLYELLGKRVKALDFLVALGTHQPMKRAALNKLLGVKHKEWPTKYPGVRVFNHEWQKAGTFKQIGTIPEAEIAKISNGLLSMPVDVTINKRIFDYDRLMICGPVFPHEVVGFSGGNKYFFPGIAGPEVINFTHWLGALITCSSIIGTKQTPVRAVIDRAASFINVPKLCVAFVVKGHDLAGCYVGQPEEAWAAAADLSAGLHVVYVPKPFKTIVSVMPEMYDDLWTAAKGMYKMEPVVAEGGEVIIYAPHLTEISYTHGKVIDEVGYHVRDFFVKQWDKYRKYPWGVLAHSTHLRGNGSFENGVEKPRATVTLATGIPEERCRKVNLNYRDPRTIVLDDYKGREADGVLLVPKAGEMLYRLTQ
jgi:nickel-dependent lactate racemase